MGSLTRCSVHAVCKARHAESPGESLHFVCLTMDNRRPHFNHHSQSPQFSHSQQGFQSPYVIHQQQPLQSHMSPIRYQEPSPLQRKKTRLIPLTPQGNLVIDVPVAERVRNMGKYSNAEEFVYLRYHSAKLQVKMDLI